MGEKWLSLGANYFLLWLTNSFLLWEIFFPCDKFVFDARSLFCCDQFVFNVTTLFLMQGICFCWANVFNVTILILMQGVCFCCDQFVFDWMTILFLMWEVCFCWDQFVSVNVTNLFSTWGVSVLLWGNFFSLLGICFWCD